MIERSLRVAHVGSLTGDSADGVTRTIEGLVKHLPACGVETELWQFTPDVRLPTRHETAGIRILYLPMPHPAHPLAMSRKQWDSFSCTTPVDLLHLHSVFRLPNVWAFHSRLPYVLAPNGGYSDGVLRGRRRWLKQLWIALWERRLWANARFLHAVSESEARNLKRLPRAPIVQVIPNGVDACSLAPRPQESTHPSSWLFLGRLCVRQKGLDLLLHAYAQARQRCPLPRVHIVGPDFRGGLSTLQSLAHSLGLAAEVTFAGPLFGKAKQDALREATTLVQLSRWEGMPFSVLEAMAVGLPVLVTPGTNLSADVASANAGWTCESNVESIAMAMCAAATASSAERTEKATNAHNLVRTCFTWEALAGKMAQAYLAALATTNSRRAGPRHAMPSSR
jgi:glycosyltransferase involved in cell wall biosynthesis